MSDKGLTGKKGTHKNGRRHILILYGITDFAFAPDGMHLAITGVDGQMRIIDYRNEKLTDVFSSYYGKLTCVDWSPDGRYILVGVQGHISTGWHE